MMLYYEHKRTEDVICSLNNQRDLINGKGEQQTTITDVIIPNYKLGTGVISTVMDYETLKNNYRRINKRQAYSKYPDFGQWRHVNDKNNASVSNYGFYYLNLLLGKREKGFN